MSTSASRGSGVVEVSADRAGWLDMLWAPACAWICNLFFSRKRTFAQLPDVPLERIREAETMLRRVEGVYRGMNRYADRGVVNPDGRAALGRIDFATRYVAPGFFRFEHEAHGPEQVPGGGHRGVIWASDAPRESRLWWTLKPKEVRRGAQSMNVAAFWGVTGCASGLIAELLRDGLGGGLVLTRLDRPRVEASTTLDGTACDVVAGLWGPPKDAQPVRLTIERDSGLIRVIELDWGDDDASRIELTPMDASGLTEADFAFTPPGS